MSEKYLKRHHHRWWIKFNVSPDVRHAFEDKTAVMLPAGESLAQAKRLRDKIIPELKAKVRAVRAGTPTGDTDLILKALELREVYEAERRRIGDEAIAEQDFSILGHIVDLADDIRQRRGDGTTYNPESVRSADKFYDIATGRLNYVKSVIDDFKKQYPVAPNSERVRELAYRRLFEYRPEITFSFSRVDAGLFVGWLQDTYDLNARAANQHIWPYTTLWKWAIRRGYAKGNPWTDQSLPTKHETRQTKRPFEDDEVRTLLSADGVVGDAFRILLLSGMRVHELTQLKSADVGPNFFHILDSKTKAGRRRVWIHSGLLQVVSGRFGGSYLIDECHGSVRALSSRLDRYRQTHGLDIRPGGQKSSEIDNHSCRRWAITQMLRAGQPLELVRATVGHSSRADVTLGYLGDWSENQLRDCIQSIKLPE